MTDPFELDQFIDEMNAGLLEKHPRPHRTPIGLARHLIETKIMRASRDQNATERIQRGKTKPMVYDDETLEADVSRIILPPNAKI